MTRTFCDICGKEIKLNDEWSHYKLKRYDVSWQEGWWTNLDVHDVCWREICNIVKEKVENK